MAINFPDSPTDGQQFQVGSTTYTYSSSKQYWRSERTGGGTTTPTETTEPAFGSANDLMLLGIE